MADYGDAREEAVRAVVPDAKLFYQAVTTARDVCDRDMRRRVLALFPEVKVIVRHPPVYHGVFAGMTEEQRALTLDDWLRYEANAGRGVYGGHVSLTPGWYDDTNGVRRQGWFVEQTLSAPNLIPPEPEPEDMVDVPDDYHRPGVQ